MSDETIYKLQKTLEFFLSLHEADEISYMITGDEFTANDIIDKLEKYRADDEQIVDEDFDKEIAIQRIDDFIKAIKSGNQTIDKP